MTLQLRRGIAVYHSLYVALSLNLKRCHLYIKYFVFAHTSYRCACAVHTREGERGRYRGGRGRQGCADWGECAVFD